MATKKSSLLSSLSDHTEAELVAIGFRHGTQDLISFARASLTRHSSYDFSTYNLGAAWAAALSAQVDTVDAAVRNKEDIDATHLPTGLLLAEVMGEVKIHRRHMLTIVRLTAKLRDKVKGLGTGSSVNALTASVKRLVPLVTDPSAQARGGSAAVGAEATALLAKLKAADTAHHKALASVSGPVRKVALAKGVVYEELRLLAVAARTVAPAEARLFAVSRLKSKKTKK